MVQVVRGRPYFFDPPWRSAIIFVAATLAVFFATHRFVHLGGLVMVLLAVLAANPRLSPVNGSLVWIPILATSILASVRPDLGIPLALWGAGTWLIASIETRVTKVPYPEASPPPHVHHAPSEPPPPKS